MSIVSKHNITGVAIFTIKKQRGILQCHKFWMQYEILFKEPEKHSIIISRSEKKSQISPSTNPPMSLDVGSSYWRESWSRFPSKRSIKLID